MRKPVKQESSRTPGGADYECYPAKPANGAKPGGCGGRGGGVASGPWPAREKKRHAALFGVRHVLKITRLRGRRRRGRRKPRIWRRFDRSDWRYGGRFKSGEGIFDQVAGTVKLLVVNGPNEAVAAVGDSRAVIGGNQTFKPPVGIVTPLADHLGGAGRDQGRGLSDVVAFAAGHDKAHRKFKASVSRITLLVSPPLERPMASRRLPPRLRVPCACTLTSLASATYSPTRARLSPTRESCPTVPSAPPPPPSHMNAAPVRIPLRQARPRTARAREPHHRLHGNQCACLGRPRPLRLPLFSPVRLTLSGASNGPRPVFLRSSALFHSTSAVLFDFEDMS